MSLHKFLASLSGVRSTGDQHVARCPAHDDKTASLSVSTGDDGRILLHCHAGCELDAVLDAAGLTTRDLFPGLNENGQGVGRTVAEYDYRDERGQLQYQVVRFEPKDFRQRRPDGSGGFIWSVKGVRPLLYHLDRLAGHDTVVVAEGEKDVDMCWRLDVAATCNASGAGKWKPVHTQQLVAAGVKNVVVVPDNDEPGRRHANQIVASCSAAGLKAAVISLPGVGLHGDISDWLTTGHTADELLELIASATGATTAADPGTTEPATIGPPTTSLDSVTPAPGVAQLLQAVRTFIHKYVVMTDAQETAVALWVLHCHAIDAFDVTGYLHVTAATMRTGKTRLLEALSMLVPRPWLTGRVSAAVLPRKIEVDRPTLLLDESDATFKMESEYTEALRGILNAGYKRSGRTTLCVGQGANITFKDFATFGPKAIAGIGRLPGTVADRAIPIKLKRRRREEVVDRWRERDAERETAALREQLTIWAITAVEMLRIAEPTVPDSLNDRAGEVWQPMLAIADAAAGEWPAAARAAAIALSGDVEEDDLGVELLRDIAAVLAEQDVDAVRSSELLTSLNALSDRPWATWSKGQGMTGHALARMLKAFDIIPAGAIRIDGKVARGYRLVAFDDAFSRYGVHKTLHRNEINKKAADSPILECNTGSSRNGSGSVTNTTNIEASYDATLLDAGMEGPVDEEVLL